LNVGIEALNLSGYSEIITLGFSEVLLIGCCFIRNGTFFCFYMSFFFMLLLFLCPALISLFPNLFPVDLLLKDPVDNTSSLENPAFSDEFWF
jgi:hypothetical protein